jgi:hypothetical protein
VRLGFVAGVTFDKNWSVFPTLTVPEVGDTPTLTAAAPSAVGTASRITADSRALKKIL